MLFCYAQKAVLCNLVNTPVFCPRKKQRKHEWRKGEGMNGGRKEKIREGGYVIRILKMNLTVSKCSVKPALNIKILLETPNGKL